MSKATAVLLGTALGDALGLAVEGMSAKAIERWVGRVDRYRLLGRVGIVSDDTELSALLAASLARHPGDLEACVRSFRWSLFQWFLRLPFGVGLATLRACVRIGLGVRQSGVASAGNGAAMRAAIVGVFWADDAARRHGWSDALARVTHTDARAVEGARFVAELAALCTRAPEGVSRAALVRAAQVVVEEPSLAGAIARACELGESGAGAEVAARELGVTGFVVHSVPVAVWGFVAHGGDAREALVQVVAAGGDTDSNAAIAGAWLGALHGEAGLPPELVEGLAPGPFGEAHLRGLGEACSAATGGVGVEPPRLQWVWAWARNVALVPVVFAHALRIVATRR